ncbi:hypothetical protein [Lactobacillus amylovorus]|uniref:hypothetical protein n=1 Tax=Lactobacillus amylovorus TaxID=1604 RepID=UPI0021A54F71|nr:hypothetical protein [Lactobacillus amylovorus]MCI7335863.1 hypothetical protein [Lactobacillus amylovorus]MCT3600472.1 hypothetical protein [Lactobacillus amylovorus]
MKTKKLFTSLAAAVMLSAGLAGTGMAMGQPVHAAGTTQSSNTKAGTVSVRTVSATVNSDNPKLVVVAKDQTNTDQIDSNYTKGQTINVLWSTEAKQGDKTVTLYYIENRTINGKDSFVFIPSTDVTTSGNVPTKSAFVEQANNDIQDAYKRSLQYITVTPKSKKGAKIYYAYKKSKKSKKITFAASKKTIKYGKKYKSSLIVKTGKTRYVYIGKKRYVKLSALKIVSAKYAPLNLPDDLKNLIVEN